MNDVRALAFYLPQYHVTPENDQWWGDGFTDWTTVRRARQLFPNHWQPRTPGALGYYDLGDDAVRSEQAHLARAAGVSGFAYWHYWFGGRRVLDMPSERLFASNEPDFGICFAWANVSWTRAWTGQSRRVLIAQEYPEGDHERHYAFLLRPFDDPRYVRVHDRPLFVFFRPDLVPDLAHLVEVWHREAERAGEEPPFLVGELDFDGGGRQWLKRNSSLLDGVIDLSWNRAWGRTAMKRRLLPRRRPVRVDYRRVARRVSIPEADLECPQFPLVLTGWDNTPRYGVRGLVAKNYEPQRLAEATAAARAQAEDLAPGERLIFVKSWNEWSEGNYLEPDDRHGSAWLDAFQAGMAHIAEWDDRNSPSRPAG